jgi:uncharacterized membrane protein YsdA (DUF1294 family)
VHTNEVILFAFYRSVDSPATDRYMVRILPTIVPASRGVVGGDFTPLNAENGLRHQTARIPSRALLALGLTARLIVQLQA